MVEQYKKLSDQHEWIVDVDPTLGFIMRSGTYSNVVRRMANGMIPTLTGGKKRFDTLAMDNDFKRWAIAVFGSSLAEEGIAAVVKAATELADTKRNPAIPPKMPKIAEQAEKILVQEDVELKDKYLQLSLLAPVSTFDQDEDELLEMKGILSGFAEESERNAKLQKEYKDGLSRINEAVKNPTTLAMTIAEYAKSNEKLNSMVSTYKEIKASGLPIEDLVADGYDRAEREQRRGEMEKKVIHETKAISRQIAEENRRNEEKPYGVNRKEDEGQVVEREQKRILPCADAEEVLRDIVRWWSDSDLSDYQRMFFKVGMEKLLKKLPDVEPTFESDA